MYYQNRLNFTKVAACVQLDMWLSLIPGWAGFTALRPESWG